jgi:hypothetical protein
MDIFGSKISSSCEVPLKLNLKCRYRWRLRAGAGRRVCVVCPCRERPGAGQSGVLTWSLRAAASRRGGGEGVIPSGGFRVAKRLFASQKRVNIFFEFKQKVYLVPLLVIYSGTSKPS